MSRAAPRSALPRPGTDQPLTHVAEAEVDGVELGPEAVAGGVASGAVAASTLSPGLADVGVAGASWNVALVGEGGSVASCPNGERSRSQPITNDSSPAQARPALGLDDARCRAGEPARWSTTRAGEGLRLCLVSLDAANQREAMGGRAARGSSVIEDDRLMPHIPKTRANHRAPFHNYRPLAKGMRRSKMPLEAMGAIADQVRDQVPFFPLFGIPSSLLLPLISLFSNRSRRHRGGSRSGATQARFHANRWLPLLHAEFRA